MEQAKNVAYYKGYKYNSIQRLHKIGNMHGVKRVIIFCIMTTILPTILIITPLYLRHSLFADVAYTVAESDVVAITEGMSSIFCQSQTLKMNTSFNAFQLNNSPQYGEKRQHIRLKKSMTLPDDTLEYWGFYLLKGANVLLKVCSRYEGSRILVVRGEKKLRTCGLLDHNLKKVGATMDEEHKQVKVTFEHAQEINDTNVKPVYKDTNVGAEEFDDVEEEVRKRISKGKKKLESDNQIVTEANNEGGEASALHMRRHSRKKLHEMQEKLYRISETLKSNEDIDIKINRQKRDQIIDGAIEHGGNAINFTKVESNENSVSSFETDLLECYDGSILLMQSFNPSQKCTDVHYLDNGEHMETVHKVASDGYYYYIFYSDNDFVKNDIHAVFDVYKPTFQYANSSKQCINVTSCDFPISFWSDENVIVEVPMHDGIEHEEDHIALLVSTCNPRMSVYVVFPISVMFLILGCAFL